ncbi:Tn3 family transposase [Zavarzinia compransoris]|uniref:Tn3 family transposase n=1 Tax=Rhodospirillales TaxID=204441 RepID=UPI001F40AAFF|nr:MULTISPECIES: Tn3 family transposase [Rhodospirillales]MCF4164657.1 Tn3 family transposase [Zavarzinia marina]MCW0232737.1 Tn3 family transposase [Ferrovibrio sp.]
MARRRLLTEGQWAHFLAVPSDERELIRHYTFDRDDLDIVAVKRTARNRLGYAVLLCYLRYPGRMPDPDEIPPSALLAFVARQVGAEADDYADYRRRGQTRREQMADLMEQTGYRSFDRAAFGALASWLLSIAQVNRDPMALATALVNELRQRRILLPSAAVLELILHQARGRAERIIYRIVVQALGRDGGGRVAALLEPWADAGVAMLAWLRSAPKAPAPRNLVAVVDRLEALRGLAVDRVVQDQVPDAAFERLAAEGVRMTVQHLRDLSPVRRDALLAAVAIRMETALTDAALAMFDKLMVSLGRRAENRTSEKTLKTMKETRSQLQTIIAACRAVIDAREAGRNPFEALDKGVGWYKFVASVADVEALARPDAMDPRVELVGRYATVRAFAPTLLGAFVFKGGPAIASLLRALEVLRAMHDSGKRSLPPKAPIGFVRRSWRRLVMPGGVIDRKAYEICALSELRDRLRAGDIWVDGSRQFRDFESCLVPRPTFDALRDENALPVAVSRERTVYLPARRQALRERIAEVAGLAAAGKLESVDLSTGELKVSPIRDRTPEAADELGHSAYQTLPRVKITDLLLEVDSWVGFSACFTHQRSGRPPEDRAALLTAILADGINLGLTRMAEACRGVSMRQLAWMHDWHVREETYAAALAKIIDVHRALPLAAIWGDGSTSSSDGQFYRAGGRGEAVGDVNARHGNEPGVAFYTHVSDQYGPFHTKVIAATASEAPHVLDGLLYHQTGLSIEEHYTDTGGVSDHVFGLCHLLGFRFAPRIRDLKDRRLYLFPGDEAPPALRPLIGGVIDLDHLAAHWEELLRLATSIRVGTVTASAMLRRLAAYPRQNGLALALREFGRLERTMFTLDWLRDPVLRRRANAGLNKGEARNALARAIFFNRLGEMRDRSFENQAYRASGLNLLVSAVILWNTRYLQAAMEDLGGRGADVRPELARHVAPLGWEHVGLTGDYVWGDDSIPMDGLRPLRRPQSLLAA